MDESKANQIPVFQLKLEDLDERGDKDFSLSEEKAVMRGGMEYKQPSGYWLRVGLRVTGMALFCLLPYRVEVLHIFFLFLVETF